MPTDADRNPYARRAIQWGRQPQTVFRVGPLDAPAPEQTTFEVTDAGTQNPRLSPEGPDEGRRPPSAQAVPEAKPATGSPSPLGARTAAEAAVRPGPLPAGEGSRPRNPRADIFSGSLIPRAAPTPRPAAPVPAQAQTQTQTQSPAPASPPQPAPLPAAVEPPRIQPLPPLPAAPRAEAVTTPAAVAPRPEPLAAPPARARTTTAAPA